MKILSTIIWRKRYFGMYYGVTNGITEIWGFTNKEDATKFIKLTCG